MDCGPNPILDQRRGNAKAVINKSVKLGIPRRFQKTWKVRTVAPKFAAATMKHSFQANAKRWEAKVMERVKEQAAP